MKYIRAQKSGLYYSLCVFAISLGKGAQCTQAHHIVWVYQARERVKGREDEMKSMRGNGQA